MEEPDIVCRDNRWLLEQIYYRTIRLEKIVTMAAVTEAEFDANFTPFLAAVVTYEQAASAYFVAAQAALAAAGNPVDLSAENNAVVAAQAALAASSAAVPALPTIPAAPAAS